MEQGGGGADGLLTPKSRKGGGGEVNVPANPYVHESHISSYIEKNCLEMGNVSLIFYFSLVLLTLWIMLCLTLG